MPATVQLDASLTAQISQSTAPCGIPADPGDARSAKITQSADNVYGQRPAEVASPGAFVALVPAAVVGRFLWFHVLSGDGFDVRVTHDGQGATIYPVKSLLILEPAEDEAIENLEVRGEGEFEWLLAAE